MQRQFTVFGPQEALSDFAELAESSQMRVQRTELVPLSGTIINSIETLMVALKDHGPPAVAALALAQVIVSFLRGRADRRVTLTKNEKEGIVSIDAKGYSPEQLKEMVENCREIIVFSPPKKQKAKSDQ